MTSKATNSDGILAGHAPFVCRWLFGPWTDSLMFFAPALVAPFVFLLAKPVSTPALLVFILLQGLGLAPFHLGVTWYHLSNERLRSHFFGNRMGAWMILPAVSLILGLSVACYFFYPVLLNFIYMIWTVQHVAQQNMGILRLMHNPSAGDEAIAARHTEVRTIHSSAWLYSLIFVTRTMPPGSWQSIVGIVVVVLAAADFLVSLGRYLNEIGFDCKRGRSINVPAQVFWIISVTVLLPLAVIPKDYNQALMIALVVHWIQYIGLNLALIKNKYAAGGRVLVARNYALLFFLGAICTAVYFVLGVPISAGASSHFNKLCVGLIYGIGITHYVQDAFLWRFRDPVLRQELLAHIKPIAGRTLGRAKQALVRIP